MGFVFLFLQPANTVSPDTFLSSTLEIGLVFILCFLCTGHPLNCLEGIIVERKDKFDSKFLGFMEVALQ